jgi:23S rRNA (guanosine2251-2'-O)-methyltransferase
MSHWEFIYSRNAVYETLRAGRRKLHRVLVADGAQERGRLVEIEKLATTRGVSVERVPRSRLDLIVQEHQGVVMEASEYPYVVVQDILALASQRGEPPLILVLDAVQDPQNFGSLLRTAEAVGVHGVILPLRRTVTVLPSVVNASSGASEHLLIAQANLAQALTLLKEEGLWVIGLDGSPEVQEISKVRLDGALVLVVGSEGTGMRELVRKSCDTLLRLPMRGQVESLNAAAAGSVVLYFAWQARNFNR